jgi:hypothetical protein
MTVLQHHQWFKSKKEFEIIKKYLKTKDLSILTDALRKLKKPSPEMLNAVAAIFDGKELIPHYIAPLRRENQIARNLEIAAKVHQYSKEIGHSKRDSGKESAIEKAAKEFHLSYDAVSTIYYRHASLVKRVDEEVTPEICGEIVDQITASFKDFDEVAFRLGLYINGGRKRMQQLRNVDESVAADTTVE